MGLFQQFIIIRYKYQSHKAIKINFTLSGFSLLIDICYNHTIPSGIKIHTDGMK